ncbi:hypothetical protein ACIRQY_26855 [Streptomyces sp. NPDC101490]|uniref:hypothetical protein n=1 Tax=Streptomyces sp. NPDC101490 TaxID=3366143 RepID=UPI0037F63249
MSCRSRRSRRSPLVLATVAAAVLGGFLAAAPAQAATTAPTKVTRGGDDFVWPVPPKPVLPCLPGVGLPCRVVDLPDDFVWPTAPRD